MNRLVVLSGAPGSGKSYFTKVLKKKKHTHLYIISSDQLRASILHNQKNMSEDTLIWKIYFELARAYSVDKNGVVVLDATHTNKQYRLKNVIQFRDVYDEIDLICFNLKREIVIKQNKERVHPIPEDKLISIIENYQLPDEEEKRFFNHIHIITSHEIEGVISKYL